MRFRTTLELTGKTSTGMAVPAEVVESLGAGKRPPVRVTINGYTFRNTIAVYDGRYFQGVSAKDREGAGIAAGDELDVDIELDTEPREVAVPDDFAKALKREAVAKRFFDGLSYSNRRRIVLAIEDAKTPETRQRRIDKSIANLRDGKV